MPENCRTRRNDAICDLVLRASDALKVKVQQIESCETEIIRTCSVDLSLQEMCTELYPIPVEETENEANKSR